ncbi:hypothetical protein CFP66_23275 [Pseudonocardia sp. MH-G8]|nr:hypothetical protein CFP66_23275 [Pseudonocardia sp. MH-G8]
MARKPAMMPMASSSSGAGRRFLALLAVCVGVALVLRDPIGAAHLVQRLADGAGDVVDALGRFGSALSRAS